MSALHVANCFSSMAALPGNGVTPASCVGVSPSFSELQLKVMNAPVKVRCTVEGDVSACISLAGCCVVG